MLGWGIVILVLVDGVMLSFDPQYQPSHSENKNKDYEKRAYGPVIPIILGAIADAEEFIEAHEKLLTILFTACIAWFTGTLWRATSGLLSAAVSESEHTRRSIDLLIIDQRPWVTADISLDTGLKRNSDGVSATLRFDLKNTGKSPAFKVSVEVEMIPAYGQFNAIAHQAAISEKVRQGKEPFFGIPSFTLFPGGQTDVRFLRVLKETEIQRFDTFTSGYNFAGAPDFTKLLPPIAFIGCIHYETVVDHQRHQTGFILDLMNTKPKPGRNAPRLPVGSEVPNDQLALVQFSLGGGYTD